MGIELMADSDNVLRCALTPKYKNFNSDNNSDTAEFVVSMSEPRDLNIAIDVDTAMPGATVSVSIYGGIELAGYASQRHLSWTTDLDAGVNKLSLPIIALDNSGGQVIVRLEHPQSQQEFLIQLRHDG